MTSVSAGTAYAALAPVSDPNLRSDYCPLDDLVVTGVETPWRHFAIEDYDPDAPGTDEAPWGVIVPLEAAECGERTKLTERTVRAGLADAIDARLAAGWAPEQALHDYLEDPDAVAADSVLQHVVYGTDIFS